MATGDTTLGAALFGLALWLVVVTLVPQAPPHPPNPDAWLAQARVRFGVATELFYQLGLFSTARSPLVHALLAATASLLLIRVFDQVESLWRHPESGQRPWKDLAAAIAHAGALVLLVGLLLGQLWGWRLEGLTGRAGSVLSLGEHGEITLGSTVSSISSGERGLTVYATGSGPQVVVHAYDADGRPLGLQRTSREPPSGELTIAIRPDASDTYFAVPEANLVVRVSLAPGAGPSANAPLHLRVLRAPAGETIQDAELTGEELRLTADGTRLEVRRSAYLVLAAAHDPGRWPKAAGIGIGAAALASALVWPDRRRARRAAALWALRVPLAMLTVVAAGWALRNLVTAGLLWDGSPVQAGITAAWAAGLGGYLLRRRVHQRQPLEARGGA